MNYKYIFDSLLQHSTLVIIFLSIEIAVATYLTNKSKRVPNFKFRQLIILVVNFLAISLLTFLFQEKYRYHDRILELDRIDSNLDQLISQFSDEPGNSGSQKNDKTKDTLIRGYTMLYDKNKADCISAFDNSMAESLIHKTDNSFPFVRYVPVENYGYNFSLSELAETFAKERNAIAIMSQMDYTLLKHLRKINLHPIYSFKYSGRAFNSFLISSRSSKINSIYDPFTTIYLFRRNSEDRFSPMLLLYERGVIASPNLTNKNIRIIDDPDIESIIVHTYNDQNAIGAIFADSNFSDKRVKSIVSYEKKSYPYIVISDNLYSNYKTEISKIVSNSYTLAANCKFGHTDIVPYDYDSIMHKNEEFELLNNYLVCSAPVDNSDSVYLLRQLAFSGFDSTYKSKGLYNHYLETSKSESEIVYNHKLKEVSYKNVLFNLMLALTAILFFLAYFILPSIKNGKSTNKAFWILNNLIFVFFVELIRTKCEIWMQSIYYDWIVFIFPTLVGIFLAYLPDKNKTIIKVVFNWIFRHIVRILNLIGVRNIRTSERDLAFDLTSAQSNYFRPYGQKIWQNNQFEGDFGEGQFTFENGTITIERFNSEGRYIVKILRYYENDTNYISSDSNKPKARNFKIGFDAKVLYGTHEIVIAFVKYYEYGWLASKKISIADTDWKKEEFYLQIPNNFDFSVQIEDKEIEKAPSSVSIKNLFIEEAL